jgi:hypothetical protein
MNRKLNLYATQRLIELISNIDHQIAYTLRESIRYRNSFPVSYLDFGSSNDTISFITRNKYDDIQKSNPNEWNSLVWKDKRSEMKIGKLIRMFFGNNFPTNHPKDQPRPKPMVDIESFVNKFKAERDKDVNYNRFEIVNGKDFHYWYSQSNYSRFVHEETTLGRSCLRYEESSKFLKMYSMNPDVFSMLILKDDDGKLRGRANIWKLEKPEGRIYMDRVYSVNDFDVELFKDYAKEQGWLHKEQQTYGWQNNIVDTRNGEIHKWNDLTLLSKIEKIPGSHYKYYPYLDTLCVYNTENKTLTNDGRLRVLEPHILLTDYQGSYHSEIDGRDRVFSDVYNEFIIREEAVFVEIDDTWIFESDSVYVHNSGGKYAYRHSNKIVESYIYKRKYFLKDDAEFSDYLGTYVHKESIRIAYLDSDKKEEVKIHYKMIGREFEEKDGVIIKKKITQNPNPSTKQSTLDKNSIQEMLRIFDRDGSTQNTSRRRRRTLEDVLRYTDDNTEEDSDLFSNINLDIYTDEDREYILQLLEQQRSERIRRNNEHENLRINFNNPIMSGPFSEQPMENTNSDEPENDTSNDSDNDNDRSRHTTCDIEESTWWQPREIRDTIAFDQLIRENLNNPYSYLVNDGSLESDDNQDDGIDDSQ